MPRAFQRPNPNIYNTDYIRNKRNKVMYNDMVNVAVNKKRASYDGKTKINSNGYLRNTNSHETLRSLRYGSALCAPRDISGTVTEPYNIVDKCPCRIPLTFHMRNALYHWFLPPRRANFNPNGNDGPNAMLKALETHFGFGPDFICLPWNPFEQPHAYNAGNIWSTPICAATDASGNLCTQQPPPFSIVDASGTFGSCPFDLSGETQALPFRDATGDCSGATCGPTFVSIYGAHMMFDLSGNNCNSTYLPDNAVSFDQRLLSTWRYFWEPIIKALPHDHPALSVGSFFLTKLDEKGHFGARPSTTIDNYLSTFTQKTPLRFFRSIR